MSVRSAIAWWSVAASTLLGGCSVDGVVGGPVADGGVQDSSVTMFHTPDSSKPSMTHDGHAADSTADGASGGLCEGHPVFCDDYSDPALGADYTAYQGTWTRAKGHYSVTDANPWQRARSTLAPHASSFDVTVHASTIGDYGVGVLYGASPDADDGYAVLVHPAQFQSVYLKQLVPGQPDNTIASAPLPAGLAGTPLTLRVVREGSQVTVWLNSQQILQASDGATTLEGRLGLLLSDTNLTTTDGGEAAGATFQLFRIDSESGATTTPGDAATDSASGSMDAQITVDASSSAVKPAPTGPPVPAGGWHVAFADDFNVPLGAGAGQDNMWWPSQSWNADPNNDVAGNNSYETEVYNASQVSTSGGLLRLTAVYSTDHYVSGMVTSPVGIAGYEGFTWTPGDGATWAFEIVCQWPVDTGELFNAWWSSTQTGWSDERDFFEGHTTTGGIDTDWIYGTSPVTQDYYETTLGFDPSAAMHRYTYVVNADQSWSTYIDGTLQTWVGNDGVSPVESSDDAPMELIVNYALSATTFMTGTRTFLVDSVAVYQDEGHAGQSIAGGGVAPGTVVGG
jgi:hypothetical protein